MRDVATTAPLPCQRLFDRTNNNVMNVMMTSVNVIFYTNSSLDSYETQGKLRRPLMCNVSLQPVM